MACADEHALRGARHHHAGQNGANGGEPRATRLDGHGRTTLGPSVDAGVDASRAMQGMLWRALRLAAAGPDEHMAVEAVVRCSLRSHVERRLIEAKEAGGT